MYYLFICIYACVICLFLNHNNIFMICSNKFVQVASKVQAGAGPAELWSKKCNRLRPQVKKRPLNFNQ